MSADDLPPPPSLQAMLADGPVTLFLDFDGTLVDLAETPDGIDVPRDLAERLAELSHRLGGRLALVSGRSIDDLERHCGPLAIDCAGSHGAERRRADGSPLSAPPEPLPQGLIEEIARYAELAGIRYEAKPYGAALHSRASPELERDCAVFMRDIAESRGLVAKHGKRVAELVRPGADKGHAVHDFMGEEPFAGSRPLFLGDDVTDEDGFEACEELGGFGVAVGTRPTQGARYGLADPAAVKQWLGL